MDRQAFEQIRAKVFVKAETLPWGVLLEYRGTQSDLIAAGIASPYMFEDMSKSGQRWRSDEFGDKYHVKRQRNGNGELTFYNSDTPHYADVTTSGVEKCKWYPTAKAEVDHVVNDIIACARASR